MQVLGAHPERAEQPWPPGFEAGIAHRLDVPTSGALWLADHPEELAQMRALFAAGALRKVYRFEAARDVSWHTHTIDYPIAHDKHRKKRMVVQRGNNTPHRGRWYPAHTEFMRLDGHLWQATISTGVMHQIRAHAGFVGIPLRGDRLYGGGQAINPQVPFHLHHVGLAGPSGETDPVPLPQWAQVPPSALR